ncbi:MAG TPA: DedA family protein [Bryobacteraceae bacterium]|jgi:membrane protein DedA with SNARE-associated domain|nr:DedA family protein [Bryobacteraceae bacterium]
MHWLSLHYLLLRHGYLFLFVYTLAVSAGLPLPADPVFLLMGATIGNHQNHFVSSLLAAVIAAVLGDTVWYELGRRKGRSVLKLLCKLALEPDTCVRKTETAFGRRGAGAFLFAKFVPGLGIASACLAGVSKLPYARFLLADAAGCTLWISSYLLLGRIFHRQIDALIAALGLFGRRAGVLFLALIALYIGFKYIQRRLFFRKLRINRVTPQEARALLEAAEAVAVIDLRHPSDIEREGLKIAGARILRPEELTSRSHEIPESQQIILYCT